MASAATASAQEPVPAPVPQDELPTLPTYQSPQERARAWSASVVRVRVVQPSQPWMTPVGDPGLYGAAVLAQTSPGGAPVLLTGELFVRGAAQVEVEVGAQRWRVRVVRADADLGLAALELPPPLVAQMTPAPLRASPLRGWERLFVLVFDKDGAATTLPVTLQGPGEEELAFYTSATPPLSQGHPIFDEHGKCLGLFALWREDHEDVGFVILQPHLTTFIANPEANPRRDEPLKLDLRGGAGAFVDPATGARLPNGPSKPPASPLDAPSVLDTPKR
jgi:hypothetical protein